MSDEAKGHGRMPRSLPDAGASKPVDGIAEQTDGADRRRIVAAAAREIAERSAHLNERLRDR
jgi:hypothetical protein